MRILLAQNSLYYPAHGGGDKSNRLLLEALHTRGHDCRVVARVHTRFGEEEHQRYLAQLEKRNVSGVETSGGVVQFLHNGVEVHAVTSHPNFRGYFSDQIAAYQPTVIILSTDDPAQLLLEAALHARESRVVYLTRTTLSLPFGPEGAFPSKEKTELLRQTEGVVGVSQYVADYVRKWSGIAAVALPISLLAPGPHPELGSFDNEFVTMVNPCAVKGISIFLSLAQKMPQISFAAVPTWGTTKEDVAALRQHGNVTLLDPVDDIDEILARTRIVLVPSLWAEARSRIVVEAMLRRIPVVAANVGGIPEAKMGVDYLLPVRPIQRYEHRVDDQMVPVADVPQQDIEPWLQALRDLSDRSCYERVAQQSRRAALDFADNLTVEPFERFLEEVAAAPPNSSRTGHPSKPAPATSSKVETLSPEKRALLALRLKKRTASVVVENPWFPLAKPDTDAHLRLFCFPYAGGGVSAFADWANRLGAGIDVCPARLPGRESRASESPIDRIDSMTEALLEALRPLLDIPFAFFGHSMGAMIGFELARALRRGGEPMPSALFCAAARAPQFRTNHVPGPEPSEEEFLAELRRLEGVPDEILENDELLRFLLPALRADSTLGRVYVYQDEPPLNCPIRAYVGSDDPRLSADVVEPWKEQTSASFAMRTLPGGHFFIRTAGGEFLECLAHDIRTVTGMGI